MIIKVLVKIGTLILGEFFSDEEPRADMYLPIWLLALGIVLGVGGCGLGVYAVINLSVEAGIAAIIAILIGIAAILCWKNQTIKIVPGDYFEYTTFLGNKKVYRFSDITGLKRNNDSMTLLLKDGKVHIESSAIVTDELADRINGALEKTIH